MSFTRIDKDSYQKETNCIQDQINADKDKVIAALKDFVRIPYEYCPHLVLGSKIKYISNEGLFRTGGILIKNGYPDYIVLLNGYKKVTWSVNLRTNNIFMEDLRVRQKVKKEKDNLYRLFQAGLLRVKDNDNSSGDESDTSDLSA
jgi:hypothetical protein